MLFKQAQDIRSSEITDRKLYVDRRQFIQAAGAAGGAAVALGTGIDRKSTRLNSSHRL